ncbi:MAG: DUF6483 family protein [Oscillospiraceae bacterium]|nr:DUF6483 family protein [Oscillospiraceae bacterium]
MPLKNPLQQGQDTPLKVLDDTGALKEEGFLLYRLKRLVREGRINEGENILFNEIEDAPTIPNLRVALNFYDSLKKLDDKTLEGYDFSREEIEEGINQLKVIYKIENIEEFARE